MADPDVLGLRHDRSVDTAAYCRLVEGNPAHYCDTAGTGSGPTERKADTDVRVEGPGLVLLSRPQRSVTA